MTRKQERTLQSRMQRVVRKAEAEARSTEVQDPGTGQTIIKLSRHQPPLRTLVESGKIGTVELQAAEEIELAVTAVAQRGRLSAALLERVDHGRQNDNPWPVHVALAVRNYQQWANHWSNEWRRTRNPMAEIIWSAVIDERPISVIARDLDLSHHTAELAIISGIRHYAAYAALVTGNQAREWLDKAQGLVFKIVLAPKS